MPSYPDDAFLKTLKTHVLVGSRSVSRWTCMSGVAGTSRDGWVAAGLYWVAGVVRRELEGSFDGKLAFKKRGSGLSWALPSH